MIEHPDRELPLSDFRHLRRRTIDILKKAIPEDEHFASDFIFDLFFPKVLANLIEHEYRDFKTAERVREQFPQQVGLADQTECSDDTHPTTPSSP